jgi:hypothetical protein
VIFVNGLMNEIFNIHLIHKVMKKKIKIILAMIVQPVLLSSDVQMRVIQIAQEILSPTMSIACC